MPTAFERPLCPPEAGCPACEARLAALGIFPTSPDSGKEADQ